MFSAFAVIQLKSAVPALILLVVLKAAGDLLSHMFEHRGNNVYVPAPWATKFTTGVGNLASPFLESLYRESVRSGKFDEMSKQMSPEHVEYIKKFWDTPKHLRGELVPPYESSSENNGQAGL